MAEVKSEEAKPTPRNALQMFILYPTLALAIIGAIPTIVQEIKAWKLGVESSKVQLLEEQESLWKRNLDCIAQGSSWEVDGPRKLVIKITICSSTGDALLRYFQNDWAPTYRWVRAPENTKG